MNPFTDSPLKTSVTAAIKTLANLRGIDHFTAAQAVRELRHRGILGKKDKLSNADAEAMIRDARKIRLKESKGLRCDICKCWYAWAFGEGSECGDLARGNPCRGRLIAVAGSGVVTIGKEVSVIRGDVRLHKEGDQFAVSTNTSDERDFLDGVASALAGLEMRGYRADVIEKRVIIAGAWLPNDHVSIVGMAKVDKDLVTA